MLLSISSPKAFCSLALGLWVTQTACQRQTDSTADLAALQQSLTGSEISNAVPAEAAAYVNVARAAVQQDDYAGGVLALQTIQQMPRMSPGQLKAVHTAMQALTDTLVERAARGDRKARAELAAIERTRSQ